jgi:hypothetical protein
MDMARFDLKGIALREGDERRLAALAQITWKSGGNSETMNLPEEQQTAIIRNVVHATLRARGEPAPYIALQAAALGELASQDALVPPAVEPGDSRMRVGSRGWGGVHTR